MTLGYPILGEFKQDTSIKAVNEAGEPREVGQGGGEVPKSSPFRNMLRARLDEKIPE